ncbi:MAG: hypothetical protein RKO25_03770 [Candidatus Contendobacter sp.]|nr:hypothetical protein [Candidatus Contendobacter sp.]
MFAAPRSESGTTRHFKRMGIFHAIAGYAADYVTLERIIGAGSFFERLGGFNLKQGISRYFKLKRTPDDQGESSGLDTVGDASHWRRAWSMRR